jgi:hypothetical protein
MNLQDDVVPLAVVGVAGTLTAPAVGGEEKRGEQDGFVREREGHAHGAPQEVNWAGRPGPQGHRTESPLSIPIPRRGAVCNGNRRHQNLRAVRGTGGPGGPGLEDSPGVVPRSAISHPLFPTTCLFIIS